VECTSDAGCSAKRPICEQEHSTCVKCNGDKGSPASSPCAADAAPSCTLSGPSQGTCGKCASDADCTEHVGSICDPASGLCKSGCTVDADCSSSDWCHDSEHICRPKLGNGTPLPNDSERVAKCSADVGKSVCQSGICDPVDDSCGLAPGDGPCIDSDECRVGGCNAATQLCQNGCSSSAECPATEYCSAGACTERLPIGDQCSGSDQCLSHDCTANVCSGLIGSGAGLACATRPVGSSAGWGAGLLVALIGAAASLRRRRAQRPTRLAA